MNLDTPDDVRAPILKLTSAWGFTLLTSMFETWREFPWDKAAQFMAFIYSALIVYEWISKKYRKTREVRDGTKQDLN